MGQIEREKPHLADASIVVDIECLISLVEKSIQE